MKTVPAGQFKQTCLRLLDEVQESGQPILVTKRGRPVAQVVPATAQKDRRWRGAMRGTGRILGDLVRPAVKPSDWEAFRE